MKKDFKKGTPNEIIPKYDNREYMIEDMDWKIVPLGTDPIGTIINLLARYL